MELVVARSDVFIKLGEDCAIKAFRAFSQLARELKLTEEEADRVMKFRFGMDCFNIS